MVQREDIGGIGGQGERLKKPMSIDCLISASVLKCHAFVQERVKEEKEEPGLRPGEAPDMTSLERIIKREPDLEDRLSDVSVHSTSLIAKPSI